MKGILRPCRRRLGPELHTRWLAHLCGLCLALRDTAGQPARLLTGYDVLLVPVLTEAQAGRLPTTTAGACPLRGFRTAEVVGSATAGMQAGTAVALLAGAATLSDKLDDGDAPVWLRPAVSRSARHLGRIGGSAAGACGLDPTDVTAAPARARAVETRDDATLGDILEASGTAVAAMFAHTALAAGVPANAPALRTLGDAFGRLVHLVDAAEDRGSDRRHGRFNPLDATGTGDAEAAALARSLHADILRSFRQLALADGALAEALLGPTLGTAIERVWGPVTGHRPSPSRRRPSVAVGLAAAMLTRASMWGGRRGRRWGRGPYGPYGADPYYGDRYPGPGYGRRRGCGSPSCGQLLACDCCANCACDECCGDDDNCCCCCV